jgi:hypothetical protein
VPVALGAQLPEIIVKQVRRDVPNAPRFGDRQSKPILRIELA